jgi:hypothetical protein
MRSEIIIFRGPSITLQESKQHLRDAVYLPPATQGDMYRAYQKYKPKSMGLIDGNFENTPSPWHKEILYLMSQGVKIFGASSMGALRAAELDDFGMIGIGQIYEDFTNEILEDDDEVAILHAPKQLEYKPLSDAMVDIRPTLTKAMRAGIISNDLKSKLTSYYKDSFYKERFYDSGIRYFAEEFVNEINAFKNWLPSHKIQQKKADAILLLNKIQSYQSYPTYNFEFQNTIYWDQLKSITDKQFV